MIIGYTPLDPIVVLFGTLMAIYFLVCKPVKLMEWLPTALTIYFFIPIVTLLTLWQTVPMLLMGRLFVKGRIYSAPFVKPFIITVGLAFLVSTGYALTYGESMSRTIIRFTYYFGLFALFSFVFEMGRKKECQDLFLRGMVALGVVLALYGIYQIIAIYSGLPVRGIVRGVSGAEFAMEQGVPRINSFASEPKRLGYVMFLCGMAALSIARREPGEANKMRWRAFGIFAVSLFTFAGSYFLAIAIFAILASLIFPSRATIWVLGIAVLISFIDFMVPDLNLFNVFASGYDRRMTELEVGLTGERVYRQEFYAWDYIYQDPIAAVFGVGLGQYYSVFNQTYGFGAGLSESGTLNPLNSNFLELLFDLSGIAAVVFYSGVILLIIRLRLAGEIFLCLGLLFVTIQSLTIITMHWMVLFSALGASRLVTNRLLPS